MASPGSHQPLYRSPPRGAIPAGSSTEAFQCQKDVLDLIQLVENLNKPPILNIPHPHRPSQACASPSSTQYPLCTDILCGCRVEAPFGHLSIPQLRGQSSCASLPAAPHPLWGSRGMPWFLHPSRVLPLCRPALPLWSLCCHHWDRQTSSDCWTRGRGQHVGTREGQIRFVSLIKPGKDYGLFKPVSTAFRLPVR